MKLISYSTPGYTNIYNAYLGKSLNQLRISHEHVVVDDRGSWVKNTQLKPKIILDAIINYNEPVLYLDSDAIVHDKRILDLERIIDPAKYYGAYVMLNHATHYNNKSETREPLTGTLYFTPAARYRLQEWVLALRYSKYPDGHAFDKLFKNDFKMALLPNEWAYIPTTPAGQSGIKLDSPAIVTHHQASRTMK